MKVIVVLLLELGRKVEIGVLETAVDAPFEQDASMQVASTIPA